MVQNFLLQIFESLLSNIRKLLSARFIPTLALKLFASHIALDPSHEKFDDPPLGSRGASSLRSVRSVWPRPYGLRPRLRGGYAARRGSVSREAPSTTLRGSRISAPCGGSRHVGKRTRRAQASAEQQQAQACCALNTGCPRIGVCFPSFGGFAGASLIRMKSSQWERIVLIPFSAIYFLSASERWKRLRNFDFASRANAASYARAFMIPNG